MIINYTLYTHIGRIVTHYKSSTVYSKLIEDIL